MRSALLILMLLAGSVAHAAEPTRLSAGTDSEVVLEGSSNVTDWRCRGTSMDAEGLHLRIPVTAFRCGNRIMEADLRRALKAETHPSVEFRFRGMRSDFQPDLDSGLYHAVIAGDLSLAGCTRSIDIAVSAERISPTSFRIRAVLPLRMTDFGVTPPTALFGAVRARNGLRVSFDLTLEVAGS